MPVTVDAPLNTGSSAQTKSGSLRLLGGNLQIDGGEIRSWGGLSFRADSDGSGDDAIRFLDSVGAEVFRISEDGNVGIGTASPKGKLSLSGATAGTAIGFDPYTYFGSEYSSADLMLGHFVRPKPGALGYIKSTGIAVNGSSAAEFGQDIIFATKGADSDPEGTVWDMASNAKLTVKNSGDVLINKNLFVGGNINATGTINSSSGICVNSVCASSTVWSNIISSASGGGSSGGTIFETAPVTIFFDGFEDGTLAPFTATSNKTGTCRGLWDASTSDKYSGSYSAYSGTIRCTGGTTEIDMHFPSLSIGPGAGTISFAIKGDLGTSGGLLLINDNNDETLWSIRDSKMGSGWKNITVPLPEGSYKLILRYEYCYGCWHDAAAGAWVDDIRVEQSQTAITVNGNINLNGNVVNTGSPDCYWGHQDVPGGPDDVYDDSMGCKPGYHINGFSYQHTSTPSWSVSDLYCCRP